MKQPQDLYANKDNATDSLGMYSEPQKQTAETAESYVFTLISAKLPWCIWYNSV